MLPHFFRRQPMIMTLLTCLAVSLAQPSVALSDDEIRYQAETYQGIDELIAYIELLLNDGEQFKADEQVQLLLRLHEAEPRSHLELAKLFLRRNDMALTQHYLDEFKRRDSDKEQQSKGLIVFADYANKLEFKFLAYESAYAARDLHVSRQSSVALLRYVGGLNGYIDLKHQAIERIVEQEGFKAAYAKTLVGLIAGTNYPYGDEFIKRYVDHQGMEHRWLCYYYSSLGLLTAAEPECDEAKMSLPWQYHQEINDWYQPKPATLPADFTEPVT